MDSLSDELILEGLNSEDEQRVNEVMTYLYQRLYYPVEQLLLRNNGAKPDVPDVFQDGLVALYKLVRRGKIDSGTKIEGYLYAICRNLWLKELKKRKPTTELDDATSNKLAEEVTIKTYLDQEQRGIIKRLLSQLGADCAKLLNYFYYDQKRMKEIVPLMGFSNEQVAKNKKSKCMKQLRTLVSEQSLTRDFFY